MLSRLIEACARNRFLVFVFVLMLTLAGVWSLRRIPLDALPDISDVQVVVHTNWEGEPPDIIEDQVTYPIVASLLAAPHVKAVRGQTMFGDSYVYVLFQDGTDIYWARSRVLEYLQQLSGRLPQSVHPVIGPDATGADWIYEYVIVDKSHTHSLADLRSLQDWRLRYQLETVPGVAEVATIGGYVRQYQVRLDPQKLLAYNIPLSVVIDRVQKSANEVGGRVLDLNGARYMIRGLGYLRSLDDLASVAVGSKEGAPVLLRDLGEVAFGPDIREGVAEWNGEGETVGGIVVMRQGMNALNVIRGVERKIKELGPSLPPGVQIIAGYNRAGLILASIATLKRSLLEEAVMVSLVIVVSLLHFRSALIAIVTLPIAALISFLPMYALGVSSNIMSLGGLALAIGVLADAAIVMVENGHRRLAERQQLDPTPLSDVERRGILIGAAKQVGPAIFFSLVIIVVSFLPVFLLEAQEGRMFRPLAWTKTLAVGCSSLLAITLVPALMVLLIRGKLRPESANPVSRITQAVYLPVLRWCLKHRLLTIALNVLFLVATVPLAWKLGSQFMPPLYEGSSLYMPTALPGIAIEEAKALLQTQDRALRAFPEVERVFGTVGRSDSATDNAPLDMFDTTITLRPRSQWRPGITFSKLVQEMDRKLQFPGISNSWTMPVESRLDMELTGIKTPLGLKVQGPSMDAVEQASMQIQNSLSGMPQVRSVFAERISQGFYINVQVNRAEAARYGLSVADVQTAVTSGVGGQNIAENIEGRNRYPINVRYGADFRDSIERMRNVLLATPSGAQVPLGQVADISYARGPAMIRDEDGLPTGYIYIDLNNADYGGFVRQATAQMRAHIQLPLGCIYRWSGEYQFQQRAKRRLGLILPVVFFTIFLLLYLTFHSFQEALILIFPTCYAMTGGLLLQWLLGYNFSVAIWVGYIALFGIAVETGMVMVVYLHEAYERRAAGNKLLTRGELEDAVIEGAVRRLRPKLMTVAAVLASLIPIFWMSGVGSDVMKPIAAPIIGGMITSSIHVLIIVPVLFQMQKERDLRSLRAAHVEHGAQRTPTIEMPS